MPATLPREHLQIVYRHIDSLQPDPGNPRLHSKKQLRHLAKSIKKFGLVFPIVANAEGKVTAGHGRLQVAQMLGLQEVPTILLSHLTENEHKALALADNRLAEIADWDRSLLAAQLLDLLKLDLTFDLEVTGFTLDEVDLLVDSVFARQTPVDADHVPEITKTQTISETGDLWKLGSHRLFCGDSIVLENLEHLLAGQRAAMTFTDPPYNVNYTGNGAREPILNDALGDSFEAFLSASCKNILNFTDGAVYVCMSSSALHTLYKAFVGAGGYWSTFLIWSKDKFTLGRSDYQRQYEPILYGWRADRKHHWCGARDQGDVWFFDRPTRSDLHPTMKPVELVIRAIRNSSERGSIVLDPFLGSGTTLIAAERTGRICYGMELNPVYVDVAIRRWQLHTGEKAIHLKSGECFDSLSIARGQANGG